tara:strand:- start:31 stop:618 length:588 start_codon:yes stop_codon:yes gene_type:complete
MANVLPTTPGAISAEPTLVSGAGKLSPANRGPEQRRNRAGARYEWKVEIEPQSQEDANEWADIDDESDTCILVIPQVDYDAGTPGAPLVNGGAQSGANIILDGLTPYYVIRKNWWLTIITGGQRYTYRARAETVVDASGAVTLPLRTMLRVPPADNDVVELVNPTVEGFVTPSDGCWRVDGDQLVRLKFTLRERE